MNVQRNGEHTLLESVQGHGIFYRVKPMTVNISNVGICGKSLKENAIIAT